jgi:glycosyltransferase involved in cell wall biosynthesis
LSEILFSVVIACYNQEGFVRQAVESALFQKFPSKEVIVVDDCSRDGTADVLSTFGESIILVRLATNGGALAARNHGASLARGKYLAFLDGDDVLMPWALEVYSRVISACHPKLILGRCVKCYGEAPQIEESESPCDIQFVEYSDFFSKDRPGFFNTSTLVVDRSAFWLAGGWSSGIFYQDIQDLLTKLGASGKFGMILAPDTVFYRLHTTNVSHNVRSFLEGIHVLLAKEKAGSYPGGRARRIQRLAWFGGSIFYWTREGMRAGLYRDAFGLVAVGWWMVLLGGIRRGTARLYRREPVQSLAVEPRVPSLPN